MICLSPFHDLGSHSRLLDFFMELSSITCRHSPATSRHRGISKRPRTPRSAQRKLHQHFLCGRPRHTLSLTFQGFWRRTPGVPFSKLLLSCLTVLDKILGSGNYMGINGVRQDGHTHFLLKSQQNSPPPATLWHGQNPEHGCFTDEFKWLAQVK